MGVKTLVTVLLAAAGLAGYAGQSQSRFNQQYEALAAQIATFERQRWSRPPLRGKAEPGNASQLALEALAKLEPLGDADREALAELLHFNKPLPKGNTLLSDRASTLDALRAATRRGWGMTQLTPAHGSMMASPDYPRAIDAALLLGAVGLGAPPSQCLTIAADVIRLGQDLVPGAPLEASSVAARMASLMVPVVARCARGADLDALVQAAREFHNLATHPAPTGNGIELADLITKVDLLEQGRLSHGLVATLRRRPELYEAMGYLSEPTRWRALSPTRYPDGLSEWQREAGWRAEAPGPVAAASEGVEGFVLDDMRGQALVRGLTVTLATSAQRQRTGKIPDEPVSLSDRALADPFTGRPMRHRVAKDGSEITVWSVGENLRDEMGSDDWSARAPLDIAVHLPFSTEEPKARPSKFKRRGPRIR